MDFFEQDLVFLLFFFFFFQNSWRLVPLKIAACYYVGEEYYNAVVNANNMAALFWPLKDVINLAVFLNLQLQVWVIKLELVLYLI